MIQKPKGTYDVYGDKSKKILYLENLMKNLMETYNYEYVRTPLFESSELFHRGVGETTDIVTKETYDFIDRGERHMTLRPEGTAGVVRSFIENKMYNEANNISSAYLVRNLIKNAYVLESDLYLYNPNLIRKYEYHSNFLGYYVNRSDDWCLEVKNGIITKEKIGGEKCYQMVGISYYDEKDGKTIEKDMKNVFESPGGKEKYWEQVILDVCKKNYNIYLRECKKEDIIEIDTFKELKEIDKVYDI